LLAYVSVYLVCNRDSESQTALTLDKGEGKAVEKLVLHGGSNSLANMELVHAQLPYEVFLLLILQVATNIAAPGSAAFLEVLQSCTQYIQNLPHFS
jgi:hypothetical protein